MIVIAVIKIQLHISPLNLLAEGSSCSAEMGIQESASQPSARAHVITFMHEYIPASHKLLVRS